MHYNTEEWAWYAGQLAAYADGSLGVPSKYLNHGTCAAIAAGVHFKAYDMFDLMVKRDVFAATRLEALYNGGQHGRTPERIKLAGELAAYIRFMLAECAQ